MLLIESISANDLKLQVMFLEKTHLSVKKNDYCLTDK